MTRFKITTFLAFLACCRCALAGVRKPSEESLRKARDVLDQNPVFDGHNDFPWTLFNVVDNDLSRVDFDSDLSEDVAFAQYEMRHTDLPKLKAGKVGAQFWAAYFECNSTHKDSVQLFVEQVDVIRRLADEYEDLVFATESDQVEAALAQGKIASLVGVEGGHAIDSRLSVLRSLYNFGARYMTLTHGCNTPWADTSWADSKDTAAVDDPEAGAYIADKPYLSQRRHGGLTEFGKTVVKEMNRLGMLVDISHVSRETMLDVLDVSSAPVIFSHSSARGIFDHHRNVPDDVLARLADNGGVIMVTFVDKFLNGGNRSNIQTVIQHMNHIKTHAGVESVGIGSDYDGVEVLPEGLEDASKFPDLFAALIDDGWTEAELAQVANKNILRVMKAAEAERDALRDRPPYQDWIPDEAFAPEELMCDSQLRSGASKTLFRNTFLTLTCLVILKHIYME